MRGVPGGQVRGITDLSGWRWKDEFIRKGDWRGSAGGFAIHVVRRLQQRPRPNFMDAAPPAKATELYEHFVRFLKMHLGKVETGVFGAMMQVELVNDGPVTLVIERTSQDEKGGK